MMVSDIYGYATVISLPTVLLCFLLTVYHLLGSQYHSVSELALNIIRQGVSGCLDWLTPTLTHKAE